MELKAAYDAVVAAYAETQQVAQQIETHFEEGQTDEALALREEFETARAKAENIASLYNDMAGVMKNDVAQKFVPAAKTKEETEGPKVMDRADFDKLAPKGKSDFVLNGGRVVDQHEQE